MAQAVKPIPEGYHSIQPQLVYQDAAKAIAFYEKAFGAKEVMRMSGPGGKIMHAELQLGDSRIFVNDAMPGMGAEPPSAARPCPISIMLYVPDVDSTWKKATAAGAKELMGGLMDQFWGDRAGMLADPFGYQWFVGTHTRDMTEEEMRRAQQEAMKKWQEQRQAPGHGAHI
jgi:PhnB protein